MGESFSFGAWVRRRRKALDFTQDALAHRVGCALSMIRKIEADERKPSRQIAELLATQLQIPPAERAAFLQAARGERASDQLPQSAPADLAIHTPDDLSSDVLPPRLTSFIGRERELADVTTRLRQSDVRLLTLTGPGGIGKTRLALQVAAELRDDFADGVHFVNLAPISDPELVATTIAQTLGVRETDRPLRDSLRDYLCEKQLLLLLDNFEQVVNAAPLLGELLAAAPTLKALIASREPLHLSGEHEYAVPPLSLPDPQALPPLEHLVEYAAVQPFLARAQAVKAGFVVTDTNAPAIAAICHRLDGLPLAIELAAVRVKLLPPQALLVRLDQRLQLLTGGAR